MIHEADEDVLWSFAAHTDPPDALAPRVRLSVSGLRRRCCPESFEALLSQLRGGALLLALLSYDLRLPLSVIRRLRVRDLDLHNRTIILEGKGYAISECLLEDLREHLHGRLCGYEASIRISRREQVVFSALDEINLRRESCRWWAGLMDLSDNHCSDQESSEARLFEWGFALAGRYHMRRSNRCDILLDSPLDLFDKGPRIVRRGRAGVQIAYYLWRTRRFFPMKTSQDRARGKQRARGFSV